jgi:2-dehydropantoate 2-reductase
MKVAVVGCGAVGSYYGACLARAGHQVHFLLRSDYEVVRRKGVFIRSPQGDFHVHPAAARSPEEIGLADLVVIGLKTTANAQFGNLLPPLVGPATAVLTLQNGLGNEEQLARWFSATQILGGLCFVCSNRVEPGVIHHIAHGRIALGEFRRRPEPRTHAIAEAFQGAGVPCRVTDDLERTHWEKLVWNIPFNGLGVAASAGDERLFGSFERGAETAKRSAGGETSKPAVTPAVAEFALPASFPIGPCLTTDKLLADPKWEQLVREIMLETIEAARAQGFDIPDSLAEDQMDYTRAMGAYRASTLIDFERGQPLELESLFLEPLRRARQTGLAMPRLSALCAILVALDRAHRTNLK